MNFVLTSKINVLTSLIQLIIAFKTLNCLSVNLIDTGCSAYDCKRNCINSNSIHQTPGDNGFRFEIEGLKDNKFMPEHIYKGKFFFNLFLYYASFKSLILK